MTVPTLRVLSLGAGVQSTTLLLLAAQRHLPPLDAAIFADTGWEPHAVYEHLDRIDRELA
jgi:3'-phosphoadenosine 5'-phosphosulfate sulfotransferase (PAPS reductase)/FAD synthetase